MKLTLTFALGLFFLATPAIAAAPLGVSGQADTSNQYPPVVKVGNKQVTKITGGVLLETGNKNILTNPSFEHSTVLAGWTLPDSSKTAETSVVIDGKQALKASFLGDPLNLTQDSTLYASQFAGSVQGLASIRIKTSITGLKVCARQAGVTSTSLCVNVASDNKWGLYKVPFILGATSNGIAVTSSGVAVGGDIYFDDAFVGAVDLKVEGTSTEAQSSLFDLNTTYAGNTYISGALQPIVNDKGIYSYNPATGIYTVLKKSKISVSFSWNSSTVQYALGVVRMNASGSLYEPCASQGSVVSSWASCDAERVMYPGDWFGAWTYHNINAARVAVSAVEIKSTSTYSSTNANTSITPWTPTGSWTSNTTYSGQWHREGQFAVILFKAAFTGAPTPAVSFSFNMPPGLVIDTAKAPNYYTNDGGHAVDAGSSAFIAKATILNSTTIGVELVAASGTYDNQTAAMTPTLPFAVGAGDSAYLQVRVPIVGWENSNIIIGQFNGLESCKDSYECEDTFEGYVSATGAISNENIPWMQSASVSGTNNYIKSITLKTGLRGNGENLTKPLNCKAQVVFGDRAGGSNQAGVVYDIQPTTSTLTLYSADIAGTLNGYGIYLSCSKHTSDYIGKTAKAVASDQNVRSIGSVGVDIQSVYFGGGAECASDCTTSPCTICSKVGSKITSVTRSGSGVYFINGIDGLKYNCSGTMFSGAGAAYGVATHNRPNSTASYARVDTSKSGTAPTDSGYASIQCIGIP